MAQWVKESVCQCRRHRRCRFDPWVGTIPWRRDRLPTPVFLSFFCGSAGKECACNVRDLGSISGLGRFPWTRKRLLTPVFWPRECHGLCSPRGRKESDTTEQLSLHLTYRGEGTFIIPFRNGMNIFNNYVVYEASPASLFRWQHWGLQRMRPIWGLVSDK